MALGNFIAGSYLAYYNTVDLGVTEVGFEMVQRPSFVPIRTDELGRTPADGIWTGVEDIIVRIESIQWTVARWAAVMPWIHKGSGSAEGTVMASGTMLSSQLTTGVGELKLRPMTGSAQTLHGNTQMTFERAYPLEPVRSVFSSQRLRTIPLGFYVFAHNITTSQANMYYWEVKDIGPA